jgi:UDP-N-acetylmuramoylalanine--D-glutamate ligase
MLSEGLLEKPMVMGLGRTGLSFVRYFKFIGIPHIKVWDQNPSDASINTLKSLYPSAELFTESYSESLFKDCSSLCLSPGIARKSLDALKSRPPIVSEFDIFAAVNRVPIVGVTGSNGKSTVCDLLHTMAQANGKSAILAGNIGLPILDAYLEVIQNNQSVDVYILEISSFQLESIKYMALDAAVVLNIQPDHLDRYTNFHHYGRVKNLIYHRAKFGAYNLDQSELLPTRRTPNYQTFSVRPDHLEADFYYDAGSQTIFHHQKPLVQTHYWHKKGRHYAGNVMVALAIGLNQDWGMKAMLEVAQQYIGLKHRCQWVATINEVAWYNDSKATNVDAVLSALEGVSPDGYKLIWIAGGRGKDSDYSPLKSLVKKVVKTALLLGEEAEPISDALDQCVPIEIVHDLEEAVKRAYVIAKPGDVVLLSPACASFDMFKNFEARGDCFMQAVNDLKSRA